MNFEEDDTDPIAAILRLDDLEVQVEALRDMIPALSMMSFNPMTGQAKREHPMDDVIETFEQTRNVLLSRYGKMMWESADGVLTKGEREQRRKEQGDSVNQSHSEVKFHAVPAEVLAKVYAQARADAYEQATQDGECVQQGAGDEQPGRFRRLVQKLLGESSGGQVQPED